MMGALLGRDWVLPRLFALHHGYNLFSDMAFVHVRSDVFLLDCREPGEFKNGSCDGAVSIPLSQIRARMEEVPKDREIWVFCQSGYAPNCF